MELLASLKTTLGTIRDIPDPLAIYTVNQWYILDSISENLVRFNYLGGNYDPVIAESWTSEANTVRFKIRSGQKFHDGSLLSTSDVVASLQRIIRVKTSTHFQIWKYLDNVRAEGNDLVVDIKGDASSLFMFLSSPEGAVWAKEDVTAKEFKPTKFSGFYFPNVGTDRIELKANPFAIRRAQFPLAPSVVEVFDLGRAESIQAVQNGRIDAIMTDYTPFSSQLQDSKGLEVTKTIPIVLVYFQSLKPQSRCPFNSKFLRAMKSISESSGLLTPANGLLPPGVPGQLPAESSELAVDKLSKSENVKGVKIGYLPSYHSDEFVNHIKAAAEKSGIHILLVSLTKEELYKTIVTPSASPLDYLLIGYHASDRFPLTQLKLILGDFNLKFDFDRADLGPQDLIEYLQAIQKDAIERQLVIPLYFAPILRIARKGVDLGDQPMSDGELQYWRVNERINQTQR